MAHRLPLTYIALACLTGSAALAQPATDIGKPGTLAQELAAARKAGLATRPADLRRPPLPAGRDAAPVWRRLMALLKQRPLLSADRDAVEFLPAKPSATDLRNAREAMTRRKDVLALIHEAASRPDSDFRRDWSLGMRVFFPELGTMRSAARWLAAESVVQQADGKTSEAIETATLILRVASHASSDPHMMGLLVDLAIRDLGLARLSSLLAAHPDASTAREVAHALSGAEPMRPLRRALGGETVMALDIVAEVRTFGPKDIQSLFTGADSASARRKLTPSGHLDPAFVDADEAYIVWSFRTMYRAMALPSPQARAVLAALAADLDRRGERHDMSVLLGAILLPLPPIRVDDAYDRAEAERRVLVAAAGAMAWRAAHGAPPALLRQCMAAPPVDPFDVRPLRYRREGRGFVVYSVGATGKYDGARLPPARQGREAVFRWPPM